MRTSLEITLGWMIQNVTFHNTADIKQEMFKKIKLSRLE
jgi:hypothetical protein